MCTEVIIQKGGESIECSTVGQLSDAIGVPPDDLFPEAGGLNPRDCCLCGVDLEDFGFRKATDEEGFPFPEYILEIPA